MKPRLAPLRAPDRPGYVRVQLDRGDRREEHAFRLPTWSESKRLAEYLRARPGWVERTVRVGDRTVTGELPPESLDAEYAALLIGVAWHHESQQLEAAYPLDEPTPANLLRYAQAVERELEDAGYHHDDVARMGGAIADALVARQRQRSAVTKEAETIADFSAPPPASSSSP